MINKTKYLVGSISILHDFYDYIERYEFMVHGKYYEINKSCYDYYEEECDE